MPPVSHGFNKLYQVSGEGIGANALSLFFFFFFSLSGRPKKKIITHIPCIQQQQQQQPSLSQTKQTNKQKPTKAISLSIHHHHHNHGENHVPVRHRSATCSVNRYRPATWRRLEVVRQRNIRHRLLREERLAHILVCEESHDFFFLFFPFLTHQTIKPIYTLYILVVKVVSNLLTLSTAVPPNPPAREYSKHPDKSRPRPVPYVTKIPMFLVPISVMSIVRRSLF